MNVEQQMVAALISLQRVNSGELNSANWEEVGDLMKALGLGPYLYGHLDAGLRENLPPEFANTLREQALANSMLAIRRQSDLRKLAAEFQKAEIEWAAVKGIVLAHTCYSSVEMRPMSDVDLLIQPQALERARDILLQLGYVQSENAKLAEKMGDHTELAGYISPSGTQMEIHSHLPSLTRFGISATRVWNRRIPVRLADIDSTTLHPYDFLVHLCLHMGPHHGYTGRLHGLLDVAYLIKQHQLDVDVIRAEHDPSGWKWVELTLRLAASIVGCTPLVEPGNSEALDLATEQLFFTSSIPVESHLLRALRSKSVAGWKSFFSRHGELLAANPEKKGSGMRLSDYPKFAWHRGRYLLRVGIMSSEERNRALEGKQSKARLMELMNA